MNFLTPLYLLGILAVAIPIILHLINFRKPKKQAFSTLVFFKQLQKTSIKRLKLKKRILLAIRVLAIMLLAAALARPMLSPGSGLNFGSGSVLYMILLENGPAMSQIDERGPLMDTASGAVEELINGASADDRFLIYNTHGELLMPEEMGAAQARQLLNGLESVNGGNFTDARLAGLLSRAGATDRENRSLYVIGRGSEELRNKLEDFTAQASFNLSMMPLTIVQTGEEPASNVAVTDIRSSSRIVAAGRPVALEVEVQNMGERPVFNYFISLEKGGEMAGQYQVNLEPGQSSVFTFEVIPPETGSLIGRAVLEGDAIAFDNERWFAIELPETRSILLVTPDQVSAGRSSWIAPVFEAARRTAGQVDLQRIKWDEFAEAMATAPDAIILEGVRDIPEYAWPDLLSFVQQGGGLVIFPGEGGTPDRFNRFLERANAGRFTGLIGDPGRFESVARVDRIVRGHPVLDEIFVVDDDEDVRIELPDIFHYWRYSTASGSASQQILRTNLGDPLLVQHNLGEGRIFVSAIHTSPGWSGFAVNPLFAPMFYRLGLYAASGESGGLNEALLGSRFEWYSSSPLSQAVIEINDLETVPELGNVSRGVRVQSDTEEWRPGIAQIRGEEAEIAVAVNQRITESNLRTLEQEELTSLFENHFERPLYVKLEPAAQQNLAVQLGAAGTGREIWNWFVLIGIILLLSESVVTRKLDGDNS